MTYFMIFGIIHAIGVFIAGDILWKRLTNTMRRWNYDSEYELRQDVRRMFCFGFVLALFWEFTALGILLWLLLYNIAERKYDAAQWGRYVICDGEYYPEYPNLVCYKCGRDICAPINDSVKPDNSFAASHYRESDEWQKFTKSFWHKLYRA